jgi:O-antigen/teichoic acid export membrane protein
MSADSLRKRYLFKLTSGLIGFGISMVMQAMVSRGLGPKSYGDFSFLTSLFTQIILFFDLGNSSGFYVKLSQRPKEFGIVSFYFYFTGAGIIVFLIGFLLLNQIPGIYELFFPHQEIIYIVIAAIWAILSRYLQILNNTADAYGYTVRSEKAAMLQKIIGLTIILILFTSQKLNLTNYFLFQYFSIIVLIALFLWIIRDSGFFLTKNWRLGFEEIKGYSTEFYKYTYPLFFGFLAGLLSGVFDRWLLQFFSGSIEQGFYGLSYQLATISTLFAGAMTMLIMREFSIAFGENNFKQIAYIFRRYIPMLYSLTAYISCFTAVQAYKVIFIMGGDQYRGAYTAVVIMCFYPIHQTYGQLSGSVLLATGQTKMYAAQTFASVLIGLPMLYFLIAPNNLMGANLGATGLAFKMVAIQFLFVNVQLFYNSRFLNLNFWRYLLHQIGTIVALLIISGLVYLVIENVHILDGKIIIKFLVSGVLYSAIVFVVVFYKPVLFGILEEDVKYLKSFFVFKV